LALWGCHHVAGAAVTKVVAMVLLADLVVLLVFGGFGNGRLVAVLAVAGELQGCHHVTGATVTMVVAMVLLADLVALFVVAGGFGNGRVVAVLVVAGELQGYHHVVVATVTNVVAIVLLAVLVVVLVVGGFGSGRLVAVLVVEEELQGCHHVAGAVEPDALLDNLQHAVVAKAPKQAAVPVMSPQVAAASAHCCCLQQWLVSLLFAVHLCRLSERISRQPKVQNVVCRLYYSLLRHI